MKLHKSTDRIDKTLVLRAPRSRVWHALADAAQFSSWFGVQFEGAFAPGARIEGKFATSDDEHVTIEMTIERMEPESRMSFRWHPYPIPAAVDYSGEPTTLVEFLLEDVEGGTQLTVIESGFDRIPLARRAEAFRMNDEGWAEQLKNIARHVEA
jgi:uncharacterized protein YndB with AHSA1/START domain